MSTKKQGQKATRGVLLAQDRSRETLQRILDAAEEVFSQNGYHRAKVAEIISRAGIGHGTFWLYFHNKDDLLRHVLQGMIEEFESFDWYRRGDPEGYEVRSLPEVEDIIRGVMDIFARYSNLHPVIVQASLTSEEFRTALKELNQPFVSILEKKLHEHLEKGLCRDLDPAVAARIILILLEYTNLQWVNKELPADRDTLIHNLSVIIYHTLNH